MSEERWLPVVGFEGSYEVSDLGRVRSLDRTRKGRYGNSVLVRGRILRPTLTNGYERISLVRNGEHLHRYVHEVVFDAFIGPAHEGQIAKHLDGNRTNNAVSNLAWGSYDRGDSVHGERWAPIPGWEGSYEASDRGRVRSVDRISSDGSKRRARVLRPRVSNGYSFVSLARGNTKDTRSVHQLVLEAFVGPKPVGQVTRHLDGDRSNNTLTNLVWGSYVENGRDAIVHGRTQRGERNVMCKLTADLVRQARGQAAAGRKIAAIARDLGAPYHAVWEAVRGNSWNWLE